MQLPAARPWSAPTCRAIASLFAPAGGGGTIREIGVSNTTAVAVCVGVIRFSAATNVGTGLTEAEYNPDKLPPLCTGFAGHTGDGTTSGGTIVQVTLGCGSRLAAGCGRLAMKDW